MVGLSRLEMDGNYDGIMTVRDTTSYAPKFPSADPCPVQYTTQIRRAESINLFHGGQILTQPPMRRLAGRRLTLHFRLYSLHFKVIVGVHELQSIDTLALVHSLSKTPEFAAVSLHSPTGSP